MPQLRSNESSISLEQPAGDVTLRIQQLRAITEAYRKLANSEPTLPSADSPLPALLALQSTLLTIDDVKKSIRDCRRQIVEAQSRLDTEQDDLLSSRALAEALNSRIRDLQSENEQMLQEGPENTATRMWQSQQRLKVQHTEGLKQLVLAFRRFIDGHLALMIAAEDLGGPVVGDDLNLDETQLKAGFTKQGKPRKSATSRRLDVDEDLNATNDEGQVAISPTTEREAARKEFRKLVEDLMNASADEDSSSPYINITRESASVRFLVRAKVAQLHPRDARKLRLLEFGTATHDED